MYSYDRRVKVAAIIWTDTSDRYEVSGSYNDMKPYLKKLNAQKWTWDSRKRVWWILKDKLTPRQVTNIRKALGIVDREEPSQEAYEAVIEALKPYGQLYPGGLVMGAIGIDMRAYDVKWGLKGWLLAPGMDSKKLLKDLPQILRAIQDTKDKVQELKKLRSDTLLQVTVSDGKIFLSGSGTFFIKNTLSSMGFRYEGKSWTKSIGSLKNVDVDEFEKLLDSGREEVAAERKQEEEKKRRKQDAPASTAPTPNQVTYLKQLINRYHNDWFDISDGVAGIRPPTSDEIDRMTRQQVSNLIDMIREFEHDE